ncbi:unnamed protein product [Ilex paraguariensis]|uniref:Calcineurin-like phosphoesterase domain-containing protein n=1 Tax=Ilex paraguariensis TaxID=185542 RepID=A0ABC8T4T6_9AQUA
MVVRLIPWSVTLSQQTDHSNYLSKKVASANGNGRRATKQGCVRTRRPQILPSTNYGESISGLRVFVLSDLHTDYPENMNWVKCLSTVRHKEDVLLVAGDVAETYKNFILTMSLLKDRFQHVFYVPGNHDLWCRWEKDDELDSLEKLNRLLDACTRLEVQTKPMVIDGLGIIPLFSWYHESFDREKDITGVRMLSLEMACKDFHACKWTGELSKADSSLASYFDAMNEKTQDRIDEIQRSKLLQYTGEISFMPEQSLRWCEQVYWISEEDWQELCPEKRMLFYPNLPKIIGSDFLEARIRSIHGLEGSASACHVFGHTHFCWDAVLDGIRYVQAPLAYPRERKRRMNGGCSWRSWR